MVSISRAIITPFILCILRQVLQLDPYSRKEIDTNFVFNDREKILPIVRPYQLQFTEPSQVAAKHETDVEDIGNLLAA